LVFLTFGIASAFAATDTFKVNLAQDSIIDGKAVKAGDYKITLANGDAVIKQQGKDSITVPARGENEPNKFASTQLLYKDHTILEEVRIGGTHTKIVFDAATPIHSGM
jgi:hypothetical protein